MRAAFPALFACVLGCSTVELQHGLDERQANHILVTLDQAGISADKEKEEGGRDATFKLRVARADAAAAWKILKEHELPRERAKGFQEVFGQPSLIPTATQERALHLSALSGELSRTLEAVDGVLAARVHISLPDDSPLREGERVRPAAAVLIKARPGTPLSDEDVKRLVAGSVDGLDAAKVSVVMTPAHPAPAAAPAARAAVGPFRVAPGSRAPLLATLAVGLALILLLAVLLAVVALRAARAAPRASRLAEDAGTPSRAVAMTRGR
jgi:type III secretion protein J